MSTPFSTATKSNIETEYYTPRSLFDKLNNIFNFELDPCTSLDNPLNMKYFMTKEIDGLKQEWKHNAFINPPFGKKNKNKDKHTDISDWITKMNNESKIISDEPFVMLLPARVETKWFQDLIVGKYAKNSVIYFLKGRFKFIDPKKGFQKHTLVIGNMLWIKNYQPEHILKLKRTVPGVLFDIQVFD